MSTFDTMLNSCVKDLATNGFTNSVLPPGIQDIIAGQILRILPNSFLKDLCQFLSDKINNNQFNFDFNQNNEQEGMFYFIVEKSRGNKSSCQNKNSKKQKSPIIGRTENGVKTFDLRNFDSFDKLNERAEGRMIGSTSVELANQKPDSLKIIDSEDDEDDNRPDKEKNQIIINKPADYRKEHFSSNSHSNHLCKICNKRFTRQKEYAKHMVKSHGIKPYSCPICGKPSGRADYVLTHIRRKHPEELKKHKQLVQCKYCDQYIHARGMGQHMACQHPNENNNDEPAYKKARKENGEGESNFIDSQENFSEDFSTNFLASLLNNPDLNLDSKTKEADDTKNDDEDDDIVNAVSKFLKEFPTSSDSNNQSFKKANDDNKGGNEFDDLRDDLAKLERSVKSSEDVDDKGEMMKNDLAEIFGMTNSKDGDDEQIAVKDEMIGL